jgi:hypothetical protein
MKKGRKRNLQGRKNKEKFLKRKKIHLKKVTIKFILNEGF